MRAAKKAFVVLLFMLLAVVLGASREYPPSFDNSQPTALKGRQSRSEKAGGLEENPVPRNRVVAGQEQAATPAPDGTLVGPPKPPPSMTASDSVWLALADATRIPPPDRRYIRYVWCPDANFKACNLGLNIISRGVNPIRAVPLFWPGRPGVPPGDRLGCLLRVDLRSYARFFPDAPHATPNRDVEDWLKYWEYLRYDPTFNLLVTKDNARFAQGIDLPHKKKFKTVTTTKEVKVTVPPYQAVDQAGQLKWYDYKYEEREVSEEVEDKDAPHTYDFDVLRLNPDYLPALAKLQEALHSEAPIVLDRYFLARTLLTVKVDPVAKDTTVWTVIWGGLYYEFRGIRRSETKGVTDEDLFLQGFGIDNLQALFDRLQTDQRSAIFKSGVTGRRRRADFFNTPAGHAWDVMGVGSITHDIRAEDTDVGTHPLMNLLTFKDAAREDIFVGPNGMHVYAIFDGNGKLLDEAAINVVSDRTVPDPHPPRLQCALSCIACHETEGSDGWKQIGNDVKKLMNPALDPKTGRPTLGIDIVADLNYPDQVGVLNRLAGLYLGDFTKGMTRSRDDYAEAILKAVGPWGEDQTRIVRTAMSSVVKTTRDYIYQEVSPAQALKELGVEGNGKPEDQLTELLPPEPAAIPGPPFWPEDPRVAALKRGISIPRTDWAYVQSFTASRVARSKAKVEKK